jgi:exonuclease VII small subunit
MKCYEKILFVAWFSFCFALMTHSLAWAGDCSGPGDCGSVPDNNSTAAAVGGALAGGGLAYNSHRKRKSAPPSKPDPCAGERQSVNDYWGKMQDAERQMQAAAQRSQTAAQQVQTDAARARSALAALKSAIGWNVGGQAALFLDNLPSDLADVTQAQLQSITTQFGNGPDAAQAAAFVQAVNALQNAVGDFNNDEKAMDEQADAYQDALKKWQQAQQDLADCENKQAAGNQGQDDSASAPA